MSKLVPPHGGGGAHRVHQGSVCHHVLRPGRGFREVGFDLGVQVLKAGVQGGVEPGPLFLDPETERLPVLTHQPVQQHPHGPSVGYPELVGGSQFLEQVG